MAKYSFLVEVTFKEKAESAFISYELFLKY